MGTAIAASQSGCVTVILILAALFAGLWLDAQFQTKPFFTLVLILISIPISLYFMLRLALRAVNTLSQPDRPSSEKEKRP